MFARTFENDGKTISESIVKMKLEKNIISLLYNYLVYTYGEETDFRKLFDKLTR